VTDPDTRKMPQRTERCGYNAQMAVDAKHKLIAAADMTNDVTDLQQLADVALAAKAGLEFKQVEVVVECGLLQHGGSQSLLLEQGITPLIPKSDTSANTARDSTAKAVPA